MATSGIKVDMVGMDEAMRDPNAEFVGGSEASIDAIPDIEKLTENILEILEYLDQPEVKKLCETNESLIRIQLINKYADCVPLKFIDLFMDKDTEHKQESIERTLRWLEALARAKSGEGDFETICQELVEEVNERYAYSKYGGKKQFEEALRKELSKQGPKGGTQVRGF